MEQRTIGTECHKWVCKLIGFDFEIRYKAGHLNKAADALSPRLVRVAYASLVTAQWQDWDKLKTELGKDVFLQRLMLDLSQEKMAHSCFELKDGLLFFKGPLVVPHTSSLIPLILTEFHSTLIEGHSCEKKNLPMYSLRVVLDRQEVGYSQVHG